MSVEEAIAEYPEAQPFLDLVVYQDETDAEETVRQIGERVRKARANKSAPNKPKPVTDPSPDTVFAEYVDSVRSSREGRPVKDAPTQSDFLESLWRRQQAREARNA